MGREREATGPWKKEVPDRWEGKKNAPVASNDTSRLVITQRLSLPGTSFSVVRTDETLSYYRVRCSTQTYLDPNRFLAA